MLSAQPLKVLVTGANGLLGQKLVAKLQTRSAVTLIATGKGPNRNPGPAEYLYIDLDLLDIAATTEVVRTHRPDVVIHGAAMTQVDACEQQPELCRQLNVDVVKTLADSCRAINARFIHVSTDFIFDGESGPYDERAAPAPLSVYGQSKLDAELLIQQTEGLRWAIVRTVLVYGVVPDMSRSNIVLWVKAQLEAGKEIRVVNDQVRSPTLAEDLAEGIISILMREKTGIWHISGAEIMNVWEIAQQTALFFGLDTGLMIPVSSDTLSQPAKRPPRTGFIILKAETELNYRPFSFKQGLALVKQQLDDLT
ncbi:MAG: SDR family oxidoreductase [Bacteroidetes bacterium]|nr:SDR family oxidoreductase [Bacteroidota bacterium]